MGLVQIEKMADLPEANVWDVFDTIVDAMVGGKRGLNILVAEIDKQVPEIVGPDGKPNSYDLFKQDPARYGPAFEDGLTYGIQKGRIVPTAVPGAAQALFDLRIRGNRQVAFSTGFKYETHLMLERADLLQYIDDIVSTWTTNNLVDKSPETFVRLIEDAKRGLYCDGKEMEPVTFTDDKPKYLISARQARNILDIHLDDFRLYHFARNAKTAKQEIVDTESGVTYMRVNSLGLVE